MTIDQLIIEDASPEDIPAVLEIMRSRLAWDIARLFTLLPPQAREQGNKWLLIYPLLEEHFSFLNLDIPRQSEVFLVAKYKGQVIWYTIGYDLDTYMTHINPTWGWFELCKNMEPTPDTGEIFYARHVAMHPDIHVSGAAKQMGEAFYQRVHALWYRYAVGDVIKYPIENRRSIEFHQKLWYRILGDFRDESGLERYMAAKQL